MDTYDLTPRERDTLRLLSDGRPSKLIAAEMGVTVGTVKQHLHECSDKLHVRGRAALAVWAFSHPAEVSMVYPAPYPPDRQTETGVERYCSGCEIWHELGAFGLTYRETPNRACRAHTSGQVKLARQKRKQEALT